MMYRRCMVRDERMSTRVAAGALLCAAACAARAAGANLNADGDFGLQTVGSPIGSPWSPTSGSGNSATVAAQSVYTNVFAANGKGMNTPATAGNPFIVG